MRKWLAAILVAMLMLSFTAAASASGPAGNITVVFKADTLPADAAALVAKHGGTVVYTVPQVGTLVASGPLSMIDKLKADPAILTASPSIPIKLPAVESYPVPVPTSVDTSQAWFYDYYQWDIQQVTNNGAAWELNSGSHNTVVGILDTGVEATHKDLRANFMGGRNLVPDGPNGTLDPNDISDWNGHGTHVAGSIAGKGWILGVAPDMGFRSYRVFAHDTSGDYSWIEAGIIAATDDGVDVISMSIGGAMNMGGWTFTDPVTGEVTSGNDAADFIAMKRAIQYATNHGVVLVAAAGNDTTNIANPVEFTALLNHDLAPYGYAFKGASHEVPGTQPGVVTVSATGPTKALAKYSNYGPGAIDLAAPGGDVLRPKTDPEWWADLCLSTFIYGSYNAMDGTSMATPKVSAVAAMVIDQAKARGEKLTPAQVVERLEQSATDLGKPGYDQYFGHGLVNAYTALGGK